MSIVITFGRWVDWTRFLRTALIVKRLRCLGWRLIKLRIFKPLSCSEKWIGIYEKATLFPSIKNIYKQLHIFEDTLVFHIFPYKVKLLPNPKGIQAPMNVKTSKWVLKWHLLIFLSNYYVNFILKDSTKCCCPSYAKEGSHNFFALPYKG